MRGKLTCARGQFDHDNKTCANDTHCINCKGPRWKLEKRVQQVMVQNKLSFIEARKLVEMATPTVVDKSYAAAAAAPKRATKSVAVNTELTWPVDSKYKTLSDIEKAEKQHQRAAKKQKETIARESQTVSLEFKNPQNRSSTSLPKTEKDTKKTHVSSDRLKKAEQHLLIGNSYQTLTDLGEDDMDVFSQTQRPPPAKSKITPILPPDD